MARRFGQKYLRIRIYVENRTKLFEKKNSCRESDKTIRELEFMSRISNRSIRESAFMARISNRSIRELEFMVRIGQKYSRIRIHVENRTEVFENQIEFTKDYFLPGNITSNNKMIRK